MQTASLVLTSDAFKNRGAREPSGLPESLAGRVDAASFGSRARPDVKEVRTADAALKYVTAERPAAQRPCAEQNAPARRCQGLPDSR